VSNSKPAAKIKSEMEYTGTIKGTVDMSESFSYKTGTFVPEIDTTYVMPKDTPELFKVINEERKRESQNLLLVGPTGCGKTEFAKQFAAQHGLPMLKMDCANVAEASHWFGRMHVLAGSTMWVESPFDRVVSAGNHVILLDEVNRAAAEVLNVLLPLLDTNRSTFIQDRRPSPILRDGGGLVWFATMNEGSAYTGTTKLDRALRARFSDVVELSYLAKNDEIDLLVRRTGIDVENATRLVDIADTIRRKAKGIDSIYTHVVSTRELLNAARKFIRGGVKTLRFSIVNHFESGTGVDSERAQVLELLKGKFGALDGGDGKVASAADLVSAF
jgi:MoxR-like ATPase